MTSFLSLHFGQLIEQAFWCGLAERGPHVFGMDLPLSEDDEDATGGGSGTGEISFRRSCQLFARPKARKMGFASFPRLGGGYFTYRTLTNWRSCLRRIWSRLKGACNSYCRSVYQWVLRVAYGTSIWSRGCCMTLRRTSMERAPPRGTIASKLAAMVRSRVSSLALLNMTSGGFECFPKLRQSK
ncbi:hypothetical protein MLD38_025173 [Melastoma candidum]|uniref:Uncharacterized protein n=1 Tax=Melastoma candidum TaxID=119954 RepID=A0ACB9NVW0_9MYRT|nr:hypothetical protein MLD38_025173 [Melastoma candidum]